MRRGYTDSDVRTFATKKFRKIFARFRRDSNFRGSGDVERLPRRSDRALFGCQSSRDRSGSDSDCFPCSVPIMSLGLVLESGFWTRGTHWARGQHSLSISYRPYALPRSSCGLLLSLAFRRWVPIASSSARRSSTFHSQVVPTTGGTRTVCYAYVSFHSVFFFVFFFLGEMRSSVF